jgi:tetratricopeptide (TPR) repeat protein
MSKSSPRKSPSKKKGSYKSWIHLGQLRAEKCELGEAKVAFEMALQSAKKERDIAGVMESISGLLRMSADAQDQGGMDHWDDELDRLMADHAHEVPPMAWFCKGVVARRANRLMAAQRFFGIYLDSVRGAEPAAGPGSKDLDEAKGWVMLATILWQRGRYRRCLHLCETILARYEARNLKAINGLTYLLIGNSLESQLDFEAALRWFQKAHASFLAEHNWYYHLFVLLGYARVYRKQKNYTQAYWYLDLLDKAAGAPEFGMLLAEIQAERARLEQDAVDLLIDSRRCFVQTRESGSIPLGKQYVLLQILEALSLAHGRAGDDEGRGLSKAEIIQRVWKEAYRPEAHDNKLYYNINRLRKLIEPDVRKPQYLLNWKEGYRLAPGLKVHFVGTTLPKEPQDR